MYNDAYNLLETLLEKHGLEEFPVEEITSLKPEHVPAAQWLIDKQYLFAHQFYKNAHVTKAGVRAYQAEFLQREDQLDQQIKERASKEAEKEAERSYVQKERKEQIRHDWRVAIIGGAIIAVFSVIISHFFDVIFSTHETAFSFSELLQSFSPP